MRVYLGDGIWLAGVECRHQFLGLAFELIDVRVFAQSARRLRLFHNELLSRLRISVSRCAWCPLARAEKSSLQLQIETSYLGGDAVLPADTVAA